MNWSFLYEDIVMLNSKRAFLGGLAFIAATGSGASAQDISQGAYQGVTEYNTSVAVTIEAKRASITASANGCLGFVEGRLARNSTDQLFLVDDLYNESQCAIAIIPESSTSFRTIEGPECSYHHGAGCDFNALVHLQQ
ncbi:hypothetical protein [Ruegeria sp. ANG-S4]|uniref:hypothetical protein n=1 Tax=Ruegeria sp. ANG-S4 TaxID=1577904 RepID=UPI0019D3309A|nr:hypothetical protein [Ruegeria sp. ANG-S4]